MTQGELYAALADHIKDEYGDVIKYANMSKVAATNGYDGQAQILKDIAHEEYLHAQHIENILKNVGILKEDSLGLKQNAREALDSL